MCSSRVGLAAVLIFFTLLTPGWSAYLLERSGGGAEREANQLDTIENQQQQLQSQKNSTHLKANAVVSNQQQQQQQQQRHHESYDKNDDVVVGEDGGPSLLPATITYAGGEHALPRAKRELAEWLIAPNTRWCGKGNTANGTYNHLGGASSADKCCRKHDHCQLYVPAMSNRYELFNYRPYTLSHCNCDRRFRTCLKMANDEDANTIGKIFFNMVQTQCFVLRNEKLCQQRADDGSCTREYVKQKAHLKNNKKF